MGVKIWELLELEVGAGCRVAEEEEEEESRVVEHQALAARGVEGR